MKKWNKPEIKEIAIKKITLAGSTGPAEGQSGHTDKRP